MSLEMQLRGAWDQARELLQHIETARDALAAEKSQRVAWEIGCATGVTIKLGEELIRIAEQEFYDDD